MRPRAGIVASSAGHALILAWALVNMSSAKPFDVAPTEALPIEILTPQEFDAVKGSKTSKKVEAPKVKAEQVAEADPDPVDDDTPIGKEDVKAPPPPPAPAPEKAETPPVPQPKPAPDPAKLAAEKAAAEKAQAEKVQAEKEAKAEKAAQEKAAAEKAAKAEADKAAKDKAEKLALAQAADAERKAAQEKAAQEKAAQEKAAADKAAAEQAAAEKAAADKAAKEKAEKIAKAEADKAAKEAADKAAKEKADKLAKAEAEKAAAAKAAERKFDPSKIASLLGDKASSNDSAMKDARDPSRKAAAARETAPETTAGTSRGTATKLSMTQRAGIDNSVREQVMQCWNPPVGASGDGTLAVRVEFSLNADGTLADGPRVVNSSSNPAFRAAAGAATRAVQRCAPLKLPAEAYDYWKTVKINFDPKDMMGG